MIESHALRILELDATLALVGGHAATELGAERVRDLRPRVDRAALEREHARVAAMRALLGDEGWSGEPIPDLRAALARLGVPGTAWTSAEFLAAGTLLASSRRTREALRDERRPQIARAVLADLAGRLVAQADVERVIDRTIAPDGTVRDDASPLMRRVRRELRGAQGELVRMLERMMAGLDSHQQVPDMSVTVRNGRYVIPIRREARSAVGGIVHDSSATGATLFVEPPAAVEAGNRIRELEAEEVRETERILRELTETIRPAQPMLVETIDALIELDSLYARARFADAFRCAPAELCDATDGFSIREGRHPLLLAQGRTVVPFDLEMLPSERTLLVSGPNTGGKTVLLKAVGLISALAQCGIPAPVAADSRVPVYDAFFADVGDEQSIQASLSTFSAHLRNLAEILAEATQASLVLVDELGSGTDPLEGAALGGAILEELTRRGTMTLATTHLSVLQQLATEVAGVVNASLQFDPVALAPTYRLIKGIPGRSYGLSIARRLGLPGPLLARAEVERTIRELKGVEPDALDDAARAARRRVEELAAGEGEALARVEAAATGAGTQAGSAAPLAIGDTVEITTFGDRAGRVVAVRDGDAVVAVGAVKMTVPVSAVRRSARRLDTPATVVPLRGDTPDVHAPTEIDLRGMRVDEAETAVMLALDAASRADLRHLRIIHGKGTGALRERVGEMLAKDTRVSSYRGGAWNEGGAGVTIVELS